MVNTFVSHAITITIPHTVPILNMHFETPYLETFAKLMTYIDLREFTRSSLCSPYMNKFNTVTSITVTHYKRSPVLQPSVAIQYQTKTDDYSTTDSDNTMSIIAAYVSMMMAICLLLSISSSTANVGSTACPQPEKGEMVQSLHRILGFH